MIRFATRASGPVAAQMAALEADADLLTPEARQSLLAQAGGSAERLRILMATAMFLAETEHAPHIDLDLARRAGALQPDEDQAAPAVAPLAMPQRLKWGLALAAWTLLCVGSGMMLESAIRAPGASPAVPAPDTTLLASTPIRSISPPEVPPPRVAAAPVPARTTMTDKQQAAPDQVMPQPTPGTNDAAATQKLAPATTPLNAPAAAVAPRTSAVPVVLVRFFLASPGAAPRARFIEQRLAAAGFITRMVPDLRVPPPRNAQVVYFHPEDAAAAQHAETSSVLLATRPVFARAASSRRPPRGTVEFLLP